MYIFRTVKGILFIEVSSFQGVLFIEVSSFQGVPIKAFHSILSAFCKMHKNTAIRTPQARLSEQLISMCTGTTHLRHTLC